MERMAEDLTGSTGSSGAAALTTTLQRLFPGDTAIARLMRSMDWSKTPLGPVEQWPQSLRTVVSVCLASRFPILIWWGPDLAMLYNEAYRDIIGAKHPQAMGAPGRAVFPEVWHFIGPMLEGVLHEGEATWSNDQLLVLDRNGYAEECYFTFSYSPIQAESGDIGGVFCAVTETTPRVLGERRTRAARDLSAAVVDARTADEVCARALQALSTDSVDVPFALLYVLEQEGERAHLAGGTGIADGSLYAPRDVTLDANAMATIEPGAPDVYQWPLAHVVSTGVPELATDLPDWPGAEAPTSDTSARILPPRAIVLPIIEPGQSEPSAILVGGVNPLRGWDEEYEGFYDLLVSHLASALATAHAYEEERKRAEALAEIDRAKTSFFSNISHEFRTPLTLMLGPIADSLADTREPLPPGQQDRIEVAQRNGVRLLKLVNTLLDFSRMEAGRARASYQPTDICAFTAELASAFRSLVETAGLALTVECAPLGDQMAPVYVDREMWEKIILNLLSNAFKYTFEGEITVTLRAVEGGHAVLLEVRDTGVGIPASELPRLFERFHRVEGARARTHEGSGIGLALVQELVHLHGGAIWAESVEGEGTSVFVRLPTGAAHLPADRIRPGSEWGSSAGVAGPYIQEAERWLPDTLNADAYPAPLAPTLQEPSSAPSAPPGEERRARIVLADDNADMREYLRRLLAGRYNVEAVGNGRAALDIILRHPPDLVLSDIMMPELDGMRLLAALRAEPRTRSVPVILLSARAGAEATAEGLAAGADDYLIKPFSADEILSRVAARLEMSRLRTEAEARAQELEHVFDAIADAAFVYDAQGRIVRMNSAARAMFGLADIANYTDRTPQERSTLISARDNQGKTISAMESGLYRLLRGESLTGADALDVQLHLPDGSTREVNITGSPLVDAGGDPIGAVAVARDVTERRRLEREVRLQASMIERAHDAIFLWELGGPITFWNRGAELLYGYSPDEAIGQVSHDLLKTARATPRAEFEAMLEREGEWMGELTHTTRDGRLVTVMSRQQVLREPDGRRYVLETSRDITERLSLEREIRRSEARLRSVLDLLPVGVGLVDARGKAEIVNQALKAIWGSDVPFAQSQADFGEYTAWWPATGERVRQEEWGLARALTSGEVTLAQELDIETFDGQRKTILDSDAPLRDESGAIVGGMSVLVDITERKQLERRTQDALDALLRMAEALVRTDTDAADIWPMGRPAVTASPVGQRIVELTRRVVNCEVAAIVLFDRETLRLDPVAVVGIPPGAERQWWYDVPRTPLSEYYRPDVVAKLREGETVLVDLETEPLLNGANYGVRRVLIVPMRIGERIIGLFPVEHHHRETPYTPEEVALIEAIARLAAIIVERDRLQRESAESEARELAAVEAQRRMDEFLGIASHEMRTPLTSITANVQMAERTLRPLVPQDGDQAAGRDPTEARTLERAYLLLERTVRQVKRLDRLVGDLLDVSRIQSGKLELVPEPRDLSPIVREVVEEQRAAWPDRTISLELPRRAHVPILADGDRIGQVVTNYLTNALKYSASSQPVAVRMLVRDGQARLEVRDHGPGIAPDQQQRLFERFYRAPGIEQQSGSGVGLGLGLHICKTIVERHGGQVGVQSAPGKGSTFWFTVPLRRVGADEPADAEHDGR